MSIIARFAWVAVVALVVAASVQPISASCGTANLVSSFLGGSMYIASGGDQTPTSLGGFFWGYNAGAPGVGVGADNGSDLPVGNAALQDDWLRFAPGGGYLAGTWATNGVDGCVITDAASPNPKRTVVMVTDSTPLNSFLLLTCKEADEGGNFPYGAFGNQTMGEMPFPRVLSASRVPGLSVTFSVQAAGVNIAPGTIAADPSCANLITGYRLYTQVRSNATGEPTSRVKSDGWQLQGTTFPLDTNALFLTVACRSWESVYVATSLIFDAGFETPFVSRSVRLICDTLADRPGNIKIIKKPGVQDRVE